MKYVFSLFATAAGSLDRWLLRDERDVYAIMINDVHAFVYPYVQPANEQADLRDPWGDRFTV